MRQAPKEEKRAPGPLHGATIAQSFGFCNREGALPGQMVLLWPDPPRAEGLAWPAPLSRPLRPPTFSRTGGLPLHIPAEHWVPCTLLWETGETFARNCGGHAVPPVGAQPPAPCLGNGGGVFPPGALGCFLTRGRERTPEPVSQESEGLDVRGSVQDWCVGWTGEQGIRG